MDYIKVCKVHGNLNEEQVSKTVKRGKPFYVCKECTKIHRKNSSLKNFGKCHIHGDLSKELTRKDGRCRICHRASTSKKRNENRDWFNAKMAENRKKNPEKWDAIYKKVYQQQKAKFKEDYSLKKCCDARGITIVQYNEMLAKQNQVCAICFQPETRKTPKTGIPMRLVIDHCHKTNKVRGLLCHSCNTGIGKLGDDPVRIIRSARYIKEGGFNTG